MHSRVRKFGDSLYLCLPKPYCESREIKEGLLMALNLGRGMLQILPVEEE
jgi:antitoxin component of MazEF toxin-antitoxin module